MNRYVREERILKQREGAENEDDPCSRRDGRSLARRQRGVLGDVAPVLLLNLNLSRRHLMLEMLNVSLGHVRTALSRVQSEAEGGGPGSAARRYASTGARSGVLCVPQSRALGHVDLKAGAAPHEWERAMSWVVRPVGGAEVRQRFEESTAARGEASSDPKMKRRKCSSVSQTGSRNR